MRKTIQHFTHFINVDRGRNNKSTTNIDDRIFNDDDDDGDMTHFISAEFGTSIISEEEKKKVSTKFYFVITICRLSLIRIKFDSHDIRFSKNSSPTLKQIRFTLRCFLYSFDR